MKLIYMLLLLFSYASVSAGEIVRDTTITEVTNITQNIDTFVIQTSGGSGLCVNTGISFPVSDFPSTFAMQRAYSAALLALSTGMKVRVHNFANDSCERANFIALSK